MPNYSGRWNLPTQMQAAAAGTWPLRFDTPLYAWGYNGAGQLGQGNTTNYSSPVQVGALTNWYSMAQGAQHVIARKTDGTLWSWGRNSVGELGQGNTTNYSSPVQVGALTTWIELAAGRYSSLAIKIDGTL